MKVVALEKVLSGTDAAKLEAAFAVALADDKTAVLMSGGKVVATVMGPAAVRDAIHQRVIARLAKDPDEIQRLQERLTSDDLVP